MQPQQPIAKTAHLYIFDKSHHFNVILTLEYWWIFLYIFVIISTSFRHYLTSYGHFKHYMGILNIIWTFWTSYGHFEHYMDMLNIIWTFWTSYGHFEHHMDILNISGFFYLFLTFYQNRSNIILISRIMTVISIVG